VNGRDLFASLIFCYFHYCNRRELNLIVGSDIEVYSLPVNWLGGEAALLSKRPIRREEALCFACFILWNLFDWLPVLAQDMTFHHPKTLTSVSQ